MSNEIFNLLRRAHALSQGGHSVDCARMIITALETLCNSSATLKERNLPTDDQNLHLVDSLAPLLKCV